LPSCIKVKGGIELTDDLIIPVILEAHHLGHLKLTTCSLDFVEDKVTPSGHRIPVNPLGFHHGFLCVAIDGGVPIHMKMRPKARIGTLLVVLIHRITTKLIDGLLLGLLQILLRNAVGALNMRVDLEKLMLLLFFFTRMGRVVTWVRRWRPMSHMSLAWATPLGGPGSILPILGSFLVMRVHPEIRETE
jgi:hypothetical protein